MADLIKTIFKPSLTDLKLILDQPSPDLTKEVDSPEARNF